MLLCSLMQVQLITTQTQGSKMSNRQAQVETVLPQHIATDYPQFVLVLKKYYEWLETIHKSDEHTHNWENIRDIDKTSTDHMAHLEQEYVPDFPKAFSTTKNKVYKNIKGLYLAKGTGKAIETYFRIVHGVDAKVDFPADNMLIASAGNWDAAAGKYTDFAHRLGYTYSKLQDSETYQSHSYRVYAKPAPAKYQDNVRKLLHPIGFKMIPSVPIMQDAKDVAYATGTLQNLDRIKFQSAGSINDWSTLTISDVNNRIGTNIQSGLERDNT